MRSLLAALLCLTAACAGAAPLTDIEKRWLVAGWPVVEYAKAQKLPLDIIVLPEAKPGDAPLAMGYDQQRCKLVLAMRGNPEAEKTLAQIEPALLEAVVEAMFAHEIGHCWRYVGGAWHTLPAGFVDTHDDSADADQEIAKLRRDMRETRREEGFADLVGLAWTLQRRPQQYAAVHDWFTQVRAEQPVPGAHHDTRVWVRLAKDPRAFAPAATPFEQARALWHSGLVD